MVQWNLTGSVDDVQAGEAETWHRLFSAPVDCPIPPEDYEAAIELAVLIYEVEEQEVDPGLLLSRFDPYPQYWKKLLESGIAHSNGSPLRTGLERTEENAFTPRIRAAVEAIKEQAEKLLEREERSAAATPPAVVERVPLVFPRTDAGNAELFAHLYGERVRYDHVREQWLVWRGHWWSPDAELEVRRLAKEAARERRRLSATIQNDHESSQEAKWALLSESKPRIDAALSLAQSEPPLSDHGNNWDSGAQLVGVANGVVDLRTGQLRPGSPEDRIAKHIAVLFDPTAECPRWEQFLREIFDGNQELVPWIQMAVGYSLTGDTSEQVLFMLYGGGANGKSTFLNVLRTVAGDYGYNTSFSTLERSGRSSVPHDVAALVGRRLVTASETNENERLNEARIKALTGGDAMTGRELYCKEFPFRPVTKLWLAVNHKPVVGDDSYGFWRRVRLVPFLRQFKDDQADRYLEQKLLDEAPGILAWMVQGCVKWQTQGQLGTPPSVQKATESYREEMDHVGDFLDECCILKPDAKVTAAELRQAYTDWCRENRVRVLSKNEFATRLKTRACNNNKRGSGGRIVWTGLGLLSDNAE